MWSLQLFIRTDAFSFRSLNVTPCEYEFLRLGHAYDPSEALGPACSWNDAQLGLRQSNLGIVS